MEYSDEKWAQTEPYIPTDKKGPGGQGRPSQHKPRIVFEAIAHKLRSGCRWKDLPPCQTVHRTFQKWRQASVFRNIARELGEKLFKPGKIKPKEAFIDGTFESTKKGGAKSAKPKKAKAQKWACNSNNAFAALSICHGYAKAQSGGRFAQCGVCVQKYVPK